MLTALEGKRVGWFSPTYRMLLDAWRTMADWCAPVIVRRNEVEREMRLATGGQIRGYSLDNPESPRGEAFHLAVIDEAAQVSHLDRAWEGAIRPTLTDFGGRACFLSTPRIGSYFSTTLCQRISRGWEQIVAPTSENPLIPQAELDEARSILPDWVFRQEYMAEIVTNVGAVFQRDWFKLSDTCPSNLSWVRYWDLALTVSEESSYTASIKGALDESGNLWLADMVRGKWEWPACRQVMVTTMLAEPDVIQYIESALHGRAAVQELVADPTLAHISILPINVERDKVSRALPWAVRASSGKVILVNGPWVDEFLDEAMSFPSGAHDDQIDAVSGCLMALTKQGIGTPIVASVSTRKLGFEDIFRRRL